jgi:hypothetical protein
VSAADEPREGEELRARISGEEDGFDATGSRGQFAPLEEIALVESVRVIEPARNSPPAIVQAAAVAATGFVAGAATAVALSRRRSRQALPAPRGWRQPLLPPPGSRPAPGDSQTFLVHVQTLRRP